VTPDLTITSGDRLPYVVRTVEVDGSALNLTGASVAFQVVEPSDPSVFVINAAAVPDADQVVNIGKVAYFWSAQDAVTLTQGYYLARFVVTLAGKTLTVPNNGWLVLLVSGSTLGSFTYSGDPSASDRDKIRLLLQDTDSSDPLLTDSEIAFLLSEASGSVYQAAHDGAYMLAAKFTRLADSTSKSVGGLSLSKTYSQMGQKYRELGESFLEIAARREPPTPLVNSDAMRPTGSRTTSPTTDFSMGALDNRVT